MKQPYFAADENFVRLDMAEGQTGRAPAKYQGKFQHCGKEGQRLEMIQDRISDHILSVSSELAERLTRTKVRFGIYKNVRFLDAGLAGRGDLDLLVSADDAPAFRTVVLGLGGVRGVPSALYDNAVVDREDWFIPDESGRYLHLDTSFGLRIGRKFCKRYKALKFADVGEWQLPEAPVPPIPFVGPRDEAKIAILRSVFRLPLWPGQAWVRADVDSSHLLAQVFADGQLEATFDYRFGPTEVPCAVRRKGDVFVLQGGAIRQIRKLLRVNEGNRLFAAPADFISHHARHFGYYVAKLWTGSRSGRTVAKRRLEPKGVVVALIGPDGVGKSTQTARLTTTFRRSFRCASVYLGSNDGDWMRFRGALRSRFSRAKASSIVVPPSGKRVDRRKRSRLHVLGSAAWRLIIAAQREAAMRKAMRLAAAGAIVITDRWPQTLSFGYLDGPSVPPPPEMWLANLLSRTERRIFAAMERFKPDLTIHLDCDFATSYARKPGDILEDDFERRIELMQEIRRRDPNVVVVDARKDMDAVASDLASHVWTIVHASCNRTALASEPASPRFEAVRGAQ